jgi:hypothetical protein
MVGGSPWVSVSILVFAFAVLAYTLFSFAHVRITDADMAELDRLRREGVLPSEPRLVEDFRLLHAKLSTIAPAVCLRQELWLQVYFHLLRMGRRLRPDSGWLERELWRLSAHQAHHYRVAMNRLELLRNPNL